MRRFVQIALATFVSALDLAAAPAKIDQQFEALRDNPPALYAFLLAMPKGADLHNHLAGAVYAENYLAQAAADGLCIDLKTYTFLAAPCGEGSRPAAETMRDADFDSRAIDALSMRDFVAGPESAHDHFFDAFGKFALASHNHEAEAVAEVVRRAATQNESYLELMALTAVGPVAKLAAPEWSEDLSTDQDRWIAAGMESAVGAIKLRLDALEADRKKLLGCDASPAIPPCRVLVRYIVQVLRNSPKQQVFAQTLAGFMLASKDARVVAINYVQPEDGVPSMRDYGAHMRFIARLRQQFPAVHVALHAGELAPGLVPPEGLRFHIKEAVEIAHAERIGHGVDIAYEENSTQTLEEMARRHIAVEINLSSNDLILGVSGKNHPFELYRRYHVPLVICTDDEGVSRTHLTEEYQRAVATYGLHYREVKQLVRNSIEYSFLPPPEKKNLLADLDQRFAVFEAKQR